MESEMVREKDRQKREREERRKRGCWEREMRW